LANKLKEKKKLTILSLSIVSNLKMILGKIKQKQRILFSLSICFDLVHLLNEFLKVGPAFGDVILPKMRIVYLNPFQNCNICYVRLKMNRTLLLERIKILGNPNERRKSKPHLKPEMH
jgi:hypothetical protein